MRRTRSIAVLVLLAFLKVPLAAGAQPRIDGEADREPPSEGLLLPEFLRPPSPQTSPNYGRAALEITGALGIGAIWYWSNTSLNGLDWDYDLTWESQRRRFAWFDGWRFDDNEMWLNSPGHPLAGAAYHLLARSNGLNLWDSFLATMAGAFAWEAVVEFKEVVSINDLVFSGLSGVALGEAFFQLGELFRESSDRPVHRALAWVLAAPSEFHRWLDGEPRRRSGQFDGNGRPRRLASHLELSLGGLATRWDTTGTWRGDAVFGFVSDIRPREQQTGWSDRSIATRLEVSGAGGPSGMLMGHLYGKLALPVWEHRSTPGEESARDTRFSLSLATAYRHTEQVFADARDRYGIAHILGPSVSAQTRRGSTTFRLESDVFMDFTAMTSFAAAMEPGAPPRDDGRSVLLNHGYYFGGGYTFTSRAGASRRGFSADVELLAHRVRAFTSRDRFTEWVTKEQPLADLVLAHRLVFRVPLWGAAQLAVQLERHLRAGVLEEVRELRMGRRVQTALAMPL